MENKSITCSKQQISPEVYEDISNQIARLGVAYASLKAFSDIISNYGKKGTDSRCAGDLFCMAMDEVADVARGLSYLIDIEPDVVLW